MNENISFLGLSSFFAELSNESRLAILGLLLHNGKLKLSQVSERMTISMPETSRHLSRLSKSKFVVKDTDGFFQLTNFGATTLDLLSGFFFTTRNKEYILSHSFWAVPPELFSRIGELKECVKVQKVMNVIDLMEMCIERAEKHIYIVGEQILKNIAGAIEEKTKEGITFSSLFPDSYALPRGLNRAGADGEHNLTCKEVRNFILLTDKEAIVAFADKSNTIDYSEIFYANDKSSLKWCKDLIEYFCKTAKNLS